MASREVLDDDTGFRGGSCPDKECGECGDRDARRQLVGEDDRDADRGDRAAEEAPRPQRLEPMREREDGRDQRNERERDRAEACGRRDKTPVREGIGPEERQQSEEQSTDQSAPPRERDGSRAREGEEQDRRGRETERGALERREFAVRETNADEVETSQHDGHEDGGEGDPGASHYWSGGSPALTA